MLALSLVACGDEAKAADSGRLHRQGARFSIPRDRARVPTADQLKSKVELRIVKDILVGVHVEVPDNRHSAIDETPDQPDRDRRRGRRTCSSNRGGDVDVPMQLRAQEPWDAVVRVRFRDDHAEVVAGLMIVTGACVVAPVP